ncbi:ferritin-like domain-containing protein [Haloflavibacter putidus]|uniref:PA2169 family four-helix-bundle protein n=1 Tax=Haloflavibacter putidus TaxID=2576776 RepID=A0A507ZPQ5_9FLAO|nr:PA2169 family four-helix-bundle protein [Haloflavibacter putidus]TQD39756.1 PA2169 family four-helix-bundle protein [Haloflavibacter putidus]
MEFKKEVASNLNQLLEKTYDAEKGYKEAASNVKNAKMKNFLEEQAKQRYDFGHKIKEEIKAFDEKPDKGGSATGSLHRTWMDVKTAVSGNENETVMEEVQRGEKAAIEDYDDILADKDLPPSTKSLLQEQRQKIEQAYQSAKNWEVIS